ncbi:hypothetical protein [Methylobacterium sp. JK268]
MAKGRLPKRRLALAAILLLAAAPEAIAETRWTDPPIRTAAPPDAPTPPPEGGPSRTASPRPARQLRQPAARLRPALRREAARRAAPRPRREATAVRRIARGRAPRPAAIEHRRVVARARPGPRPAGPLLRADPWSIRLGPWAGDIDCSSPGTPDARRGLCPFAPAGDAAADDP